MIVMVVNPRARKSEALEYEAEIEWVPMTREAFCAEFADYENHGEEFESWQADGRPDPHYSIADQFADAAENQPGQVLGFRGGVGGSKPAILKFEDGEFWSGVNVDPDAFASLAGDDGETDFSKLDVIPAPMGGGAVQQQKVGESENNGASDRHRRRMKMQETVDTLEGGVRAALTEDANSAIMAILNKKDENEWVDVGSDVLPPLQKSGDVDHMGDVANAVDSLEDQDKIDKKEQPGEEGGDQIRTKESTNLIASIVENLTKVKTPAPGISVDSIVENLLGSKKREPTLTESEAEMIAAALLGE